MTEAKTAISTVSFTGDNGKAIEVTYYLVKSGLDNYGVAAETRSGEADFTGAFTQCKSDAVEIIQRLANGKVTPTTLCEIVDDIIS